MLGYAPDRRLQVIIRTGLSLAFVVAMAGAQASRFRVLNEQLPPFDTSIGGAAGGAADFDGDGDLDFVTSDQASGTFLRLNDGLGGFATAEPLPAFGPLYKIGPRDLDGDGDPDFASESVRACTAT